jgi:hypothetical protein
MASSRCCTTGWDSCRLYARSLVALHGGIVFWTGLWNILDDYTLAASLNRELIYTFVGLTLLLLTGTFYDAANIDPKHQVRSFGSESRRVLFLCCL